MEHVSADNPDREVFERFLSRAVSEREISSVLFDKYYPIFSHVANKIGVPESDREAVVSESLTTAVRYVVMHRAVESFAAALMIAFRKRVNEARRKANLSPYVPTDDSGVPESDSTIVLAVLDGYLSENEAQLLLLKYLEGKTIDQIATERAEPLDATQAAYIRADTLFEKALEREAGSGE